MTDHDHHYDDEAATATGGEMWTGGKQKLLSFAEFLERESAAVKRQLHPSPPTKLAKNDAR